MQRTGIRERHIAATGELTSHLATEAARARSPHAGLDAQPIDLIVLATSTPDNTFPASAVTVQDELGMTNGVAFDLQAVCSGFVFALAIADSFMSAGAFKRALVIGAETFSRILDWTDRAPACCSAMAPGRWYWAQKTGRQSRRADRAPALRRPVQGQALR